MPLTKRSLHSQEMLKLGGLRKSGAPEPKSFTTRTPWFCSGFLSGCVAVEESKSYLQAEEQLHFPSPTVLEGLGISGLGFRVQGFRV